MFGRGMEDGQATIVARQTHEGTYRRGINVYAPDGLYHHVYDYVADVAPGDGGPVFRATFTELFESDNEYRPQPGDQAQVKFDAKHEKVAFDRDALRNIASAQKTKADSHFAEIASAAPGAPVPPAPPPAPAPAGSAPDGVGDILRASILIARRNGNQAEVDRLEAQLATRGGAATPAPAPASTGSDPVDRLAKLADLHDRGVVTDDEFAAQKAKLLGEV